MDLRACLTLKHGEYEADCAYFDGRLSAPQGSRHCSCSEGRARRRGPAQAPFQAGYSYAARNSQLSDDHRAYSPQEALKRLVHKIAQDIKSDLRLKPNAVKALQESA